VPITEKHVPFALGRPAIVLALAACAGPSSQPPADDPGARIEVHVASPAVTLVQSQHSGVTDSLRLVVRDQATWEQTWARIHSYLVPAPSIVSPDFSTEVVVMASLGERNSGGYEIQIDSVTRHANGAVVHLTRYAPGPRCFNTAALTQPVHAVRMPRTNGPVLFRERLQVRDCS
jgi:hypothetical protein